MESLESLKIDLKSLDTGALSTSCHLGDEFFEAAESDEIKSGDVMLSISARKSVSGLYEIDFHAEGTVKVPCDLCLDDMDQPICTDNRLLAKLGEEYSDEDDIVTVEKDDAVLDTSFLGAGQWKAEVFRDAADSDVTATHYVHEQGKSVKAGDKLAFKMAKGGGFVVKFTK